MRYTRPLKMSLREIPCNVAVLAGVFAICLAGSVTAQMVKDGTDPLDAFIVQDPRLQPSQLLEPLETARPALLPEVLDGWGGFLQEAGSGWKAHVHRGSGRIESVEGGAIPWIPGPGNALAPEDATRTCRLWSASPAGSCRGWLPSSVSTPVSWS